MEAIKKRFVIEWPHFLQTAFQQCHRLNGAIAFATALYRKHWWDQLSYKLMTSIKKKKSGVDRDIH